MTQQNSGAALQAAPPHLASSPYIYHTTSVSNISSADLFGCRQIWWTHAGEFPAQPGLILLRGGRDG